MLQVNSIDSIVEQHYTLSNLEETILSGLAAAGKDIDHLQPADLAPVDEFHVRGRQATLELAEAVNLWPGAQVLDAGCGLGGPARYLASTYSCQVTGLDLTDAYVQVARRLTERTGLTLLARFQTGSMLQMPFPDESFDLVWTQHAAMNIVDKSRLYAEFWRVLKPGGRLALNDVMAGPAGNALYPAPWARTEETSFLATPDELRGYLEAAGFDLLRWRDTTEPGAKFFSDVAARLAQNAPPPLGLHLLMGPDFLEKVRNVARNLTERRVVTIEVIAQKA